jgi:transposase
LRSDEACPFEGQHHLVNRWRADAEMFLHVGFGWRAPVQTRVQVDIGEILALLGRESFSRATHAGHPIQLVVRALPRGGTDECTLSGRAQPNRTRPQLTALLSGGKHRARKLKRAQILLAADAGASDEEIARSVGVGDSTVYRTKRRFVLGNLEAALREEPRPGAARKLSGKEEALLVATACSRPPAGRARWTLELLAGELVRLTEHASVSRETVRRRLAENHLKPWRKEMWCIPQVDAEYVARMEDVLDLYSELPDPKRPVVCFDESPIQLIGEVRQPIPAEPRRIERYDCEYKRNGTANLFVFLDVHRPWRKVKVTESRAAVDFAACMRELADVDFPKAERIRVVLDNLSTHSAGALYQAFPADEARRVLRRLEFHYVPNHASWLNMVEIEIGVLAGQCLDRRIESIEQLAAEIAIWERQRNTAGACIKWMFTTEKARAKMGRAYPQPRASSPATSQNHRAELLVPPSSAPASDIINGDARFDCTPLRRLISIFL